MLRFIVNVLLFSCLFLLTVVLAELRISSVEVPFNLKRDYFLANKQNIQGLILGSSQNHCAFDPSHITDIRLANLAQGGQGIETDKRFFERYIDEMKELETVVLELSYHTLESKFDPKSYRRQVDYRFYDIPIPERQSTIIDKSLLLSKPEVYLPYLSFSRKKLAVNEFGAFLDLESVDEKARVFKRLDYNKERIAQNEHSENISRHASRNEQALEHNRSVFIDLVKMIKARSLNLVIVKPPLYETYLEKRIPEKTKEADDLLRTLTSIYPDILVIDFNEEMTFEVTDFINEDHVNCIGSKKASEYLSYRIKKDL